MQQFLNLDKLPTGEIANTLGVVAGYTGARPYFYKQTVKKHAEEIRKLEAKRNFDVI